MVNVIEYQTTVERSRIPGRFVQTSRERKINENESLSEEFRRLANIVFGNRVEIYEHFCGNVRNYCTSGTAGAGRSQNEPREINFYRCP